MQSIAVPVVSIGNLTAGGTGKTPMVAYIARWFRRHGVRVAIVSRGYGAEQGGASDEALELERALPDVPHLQNADRVAGGTLAVEELASQLIVLDDAMQHRRVKRDLEIVLIDATNPWGYGYLLPRGLLRESIQGLRRADVIVLTRANLVSTAEREKIREQVSRTKTTAIWLEAAHQPLEFQQYTGNSMELSAVRGRRVFAFCGIGNPDAFLQTLQQLGLEVVHFEPFADHDPFGSETIVGLEKQILLHKGVEFVVCTSKDLVKLRSDRLARLPLWALKIGLQIDSGEAGLHEELGKLLSLVPSDEETSEDMA